MFKTSIFKSENPQDEARLRERYHGADSLPLKVSIKAAWHMIKIYWTSKDSLWSWLLLSLILGLTGGSIYLATAINTWYKEFWDTIQNYDLEGFKYQLMIFAILASIHVVVSVYNSYLRSRLAISWRTWFTGKVMHDWLDNEAYYKMQLEDRKTENPDQRISEDLSSFVTYTISLLLGTLTDLAMIGTFGVVLWDLSNSVTLTLWNDAQITLPDGYMLYLALGYAIIGTVLTFFLGKPLVRLNFRQQRYEADFRFSLIRVRENSESISLYQGQEQEEGVLRKRFFSVVKNYIRLINCEKRLGFFTLGYAQLAVIFPILIAAPMYFAKIITMGSIMQISSAFGRVQDSLSTLISNFSAWASFKAVVDRLALYFDSMDSSANVVCLKAQKSGDSFSLKNLEVQTPQGEILCTKLNLSLKPGQSLLIRGPSGCGKSTLIKTIAGLWPYAQGEIYEIANSECLFLSQRPYLPQGTLREAAAYPHVAEEQGLTEKYFKLLNLEHLIAHLDEENTWSQILSLGEQQRIAFVRALLIKPEILFLDEATSALDELLESRAYDLIKAEIPQCIMISVGHRSSLIKRHDLMLSPHETERTAWILKENI
jgi:putative ATP-binding cassette transporter